MDIDRCIAYNTTVVDLQYITGRSDVGIAGRKPEYTQGVSDGYMEVGSTPLKHDTAHSQG
jgi:hypothetical protein